MGGSVKEKKQVSRKKPNFSDKTKPAPDSPAARVLNDEWLLREVKRLGWDEKTAQSLLKVKKKIFKDEHLSTAAFGQSDSANMEKKVNDLHVSVHINKWYISVHINSVSNEKTDEVADKIKNVFKDSIIGIAFSAKQSRDPRGFAVVMAGSLNKPDSLCEDGKNTCKISSPPVMPKFNSPSDIPTEDIRGC